MMRHEVKQRKSSLGIQPHAFNHFWFALLCGKMIHKSKHFLGGCDSMKIASTINRLVRRAPASALALLILITIACAQSAPKTSGNQQSSSGALRHYDIKVSDLPPPEVQTGPRNQSK